MADPRDISKRVSYFQKESLKDERLRTPLSRSAAYSDNFAKLSTPVSSRDIAQWRDMVDQLSHRTNNEENPQLSKEQPAAVEPLVTGSQESGYLSHTPTATRCPSYESEDQLDVRIPELYEDNALYDSYHGIWGKKDQECFNEDSTLLMTPLDHGGRHSSEHSWIPVPVTTRTPNAIPISKRLSFIPAHLTRLTYSDHSNREPPVGADDIAGSALGSPVRKICRSNALKQSSEATSTALGSTQVSNRQTQASHLSPRLSSRSDTVLTTPLTSTLGDSAGSSPLLRRNSQSNYSDKLAGLIGAKEKIIEQKDRIIERQKITIARLQEECQRQEGKVKQLIQEKTISTAHSDLSRRIQDLELENTTLRSRQMDLKTCKDAEIDKLESNIRAIETEMGSISQSSEDKLTRKDKEILSLKKKLEDCEGCLDSVKRELTISKSEQEDLRTKIIELSKLSDEVDLEDYKKIYSELEEIKGFKEKYLALQNRTSEIESSLSLRCNRVDELESLYLKSSSEAKRLSSEQVTLTEQFLKTQGENKDLYKRVLSLEKKLVDTEMEFQMELQAMRKRHYKKFSDATETIRKQHKELAKKCSSLEQELEKSKDTGMVLSDEVHSNQLIIKDLKDSLELAMSHNQALLEEQTGIQTGCHGDLPSNSKEAEELNQELLQCILELKALINAAQSLVDSKEPSVTDLLGIRRSESRESSASAFDSVEDKVGEVRDMRRAIDGLRTKLADKFAAELAGSCNIQ